MADSSSFDQLSYGVQRWIYRQGWEELRAIQERSVPVIARASEDILITAPTAGGKTEAAFLPIVSWLEDDGPASGYGVLCLSPLKALINDQYKRLLPLCESANTAITPWHGDVSTSVKAKSWRSPQGILMITPESLEAMFVRRPHELRERVRKVRYVVIDEFHAFIGRERGQQLLSLIARLEELVEHSLCRIALSATIGDPQMALGFLRPAGGRPGVHLEVAHEGMNLQLSLKSFSPDEAAGLPATVAMAKDLYPVLKGHSNLVFANSRRIVEEITDQLSGICEAHQAPVEFFAHHGSLSKESRHFVEHRLKEGELPTTAIATSTLELGIDIGDVVSVAQVGAPANVSSVRQRLGRSGRRAGSASILRVLVTEHGKKKDATPIDRLEVELFQAVAVLELMLERWVEPPSGDSLHLSTLIQQVLSMIAYTGGIIAAEAFRVLCGTGPWRHVDQALFVRVLRALGASEVVAQLGSGELVVGAVGEQILSSHTFYTAFEVPEEFSLVAFGKTIGTLPVDSPYLPGQLLLFGGRRWSVKAIDIDAKVITLIPAGRGQAPIFGGESAPVHKRIRERMRELYERDDVPRFCQETCGAIMARAREYYAEKGIASNPVIVAGDQLFLIAWEDDRVLDTIKVVSTLGGLAADRVGPSVVVQDCPEPGRFLPWLAEVLEDVDADAVAAAIEPQALGKFDGYLTPDLLKEAFVREKLDVGKAKRYVDTVLKLDEPPPNVV